MKTLMIALMTLGSSSVMAREFIEIHAKNMADCERICSAMDGRYYCELSNGQYACVGSYRPPGGNTPDAGTDKKISDQGRYGGPKVEHDGEGPTGKSTHSNSK